MRSIFLALPAYGGLDPGTALAVSDVVLTARQGAGRMVVSTKSLSLLAHCFNTLWCEALNGRAAHGYTHFVMLHNDIAPESDWLWKMLDEMDRVDADILSAVSPIKDDRQITSTAIYDGTNATKLSYADLRKLPATFDARHWPGRRLLNNTGVMVCRFDRPWVEKVHFEIRDQIVRLPDGTFEPRVMPEDWSLSLQAADLGCKVFSTQKLSLKHYGCADWEFEGRGFEVPAEEAA